MIGFAGMLLLIIGFIDIFQGLIALFEDEYFVVTRAGFLAVDLTAWGWIMIVWGVLLSVGGMAWVQGRRGRAGSDVVVSLNVFAQLGFLGNSQYPLWALTALTLNVVVLYALTVRWDESKFGLEPGRPMG